MQLVADLKDANSTILQLQEELEDRTNRQLRNTLIFKNVPGEKKEKWEKTRSTLAALISEVSFKADESDSVSEEEALSMIERAHRGKPVENQKGPSFIYCAIDNWQNAEWIKNIFKTAKNPGNERKGVTK